MPPGAAIPARDPNPNAPPPPPPALPENGKVQNWREFVMIQFSRLYHFYKSAQKFSTQFFKHGMWLKFC